MSIAKDKVVTLEYVLKDAAGEVLEETEADEPFTYLHGRGQLDLQQPVLDSFPELADLKEGAAGLISGACLPQGADPIAQAYSGHQFGHFSPQLGDGRAILLGEHITPDGARFDVQLKGAGRTAFSRNGDGRYALGPALREHLVSEAMAALGIETTRSLGVVLSGEQVARQSLQPGAVLARIASSHIRVGTMEWAAAHRDVAALTAIRTSAMSIEKLSAEVTRLRTQYGVPVR